MNDLLAQSDACTLTGSPGGNTVALLDGSKIVVADDGLLVVDVVTIGSAQFADAPSSEPANSISAFQTESAILRLLRYINFARARSDAAAWTTVAY